jgi:hypothetical protein
LVLIIIQRFDLARWGFFTQFEGSPIRHVKLSHESHMLEATFEGDNEIQIFPVDDLIYGGINLKGRSTGAAGARKKNDQEADLANSKQIKEGNDLIVKFSWPNETRKSEVEFIEEARKIGEENGLVKGHIPTVLGHMDPPFLTCSTKPIRQFLGLSVDRARVLRVIAFRRLGEIKLLDEEDMFIAFLDCFFCKFFRGLRTIPRH